MASQKLKPSDAGSSGAGAPSKAKGGKKSAPSSTGRSTPVSAIAKEDAQEPVSSGAVGRPDKAAHGAEQEGIQKEIDALQAKLATLKEKIALATSPRPNNERRTALRAELDTIRSQQSNNKLSRTQIIEQLKTKQDAIAKKVKDLQTSRAKVQFKSLADLDAHIKNLDKQVDSGSMKLADEKRALVEISQLKRSRRTVEGFQAEQDAIEAERAAADELRKHLDDPEAKSISDRYEAIKAELDALKKEGDELYASQGKLFEERERLQTELNALRRQKHESGQRWWEANERYRAKINEDRARRAERDRAQRAAEEAAKKAEMVDRMWEEASAPAFQSQIEDCQTLIDFFSGKSTGVTLSSTTRTATKVDIAGVPKLQLRQVEAVPQDGFVVRKKKGEDDDAYFVGGKGKKGKKDAAAKPKESADAGTGKIPLPTLTALLGLSIPPPASPAEHPRVVEDLKTKKAWFEANQARTTAENVALAEVDIARLIGTNVASSKVEAQDLVKVTPAPESADSVSPAEAALPEVRNVEA